MNRSQNVTLIKASTKELSYMEKKKVRNEKSRIVITIPHAKKHQLKIKAAYADRSINELIIDFINKIIASKV